MSYGGAVTGRPWTDEEVQKLIDGFASGLTYDELSDMLERSPNSLRIKLTQLRKSGIEVNQLDPKTVRQLRMMREAAGRKSRKCLRCSRPFSSDGPGNRICDGCLRSPLYADTPFAI